jgi:hypothetical protein
VRSIRASAIPAARLNTVFRNRWLGKISTYESPVPNPIRSTKTMKYFYGHHRNNHAVVRDFMM